MKEKLRKIVTNWRVIILLILVLLSLWLINPTGKIAKVYLSVDTSKHSQEIIDDLKKFNP